MNESQRFDNSICCGKNLTVPDALENNKVQPDTPLNLMTESDSIFSVIHHPETFCSSSLQRKRKAYIGDYQVGDMKSPEKAAKYFRMTSKKLSRDSMKIKNMHQNIRRLKAKNTDLAFLLKTCREKALISEAAAETLQLTVPQSVQALFSRMLKGASCKETYPPDLRSFALTLHFYSSKAYDFIRESFNECLPHPQTLTRWFRSIDGSPGFTEESLNSIKMRVKNYTGTLVCSLMFDEMAIRKKIDAKSGKMYGFVDYGTEVVNDELPVAKEAFVFLVNCLNEKWKVPVGYFLTNGLNSQEKANILNKCLCQLHETGILIASVTFDGLSSNLLMADILGASFASPSNTMKTWFPHPITADPVYIFLDPCHTLKLVRNALGTIDFFDKDCKLITWQYLQKLVTMQEEEGLHTATKLRKNHLMWRDQKMKVKLAAQTLSNSVAVALNYLNLVRRTPDFAGSEATATFIATINDIFDLLNSRNLFGKGFKCAFQLTTEVKVKQLCHRAETYLRELKTSQGIPLTDSPRRTGFLGFIVSMRSLVGLYDLYVKEKSILKYVLSYKVSQDHLETFFSAIRSRGGFNNNPSAFQFEGSYKRLCVHAQISGSKYANCLSHKDIKILNSGQIRMEDKEEESPEEVVDVSDTPDFESLSPYVTDVVGYIAGYVVKMVNSSVKCDACKSSLTSTVWTGSELLAAKNYTPILGKGLTNPSYDVIYICKITESVIRTTMKTDGLKQKNIEHIILIKTLSKVNFNLIFLGLEHHQFDQEPEENHLIKLVKCIAMKYIKIRIFHETNILNEKLQRKNIRKKFTKLILFNNQ